MTTADGSKTSTNDVITPDWSAIDSAAAMTLAVGWVSGTKTKLAKVTIGQDVAVALADVADQAVANLGERAAERWAPDALVTAETYLVLPAEQVGDRPVLARTVDQYGVFLNALQAASALPVLSATAIPAAQMSFYALVVGDTPEHRTVFIRRLNPRRSLQAGRIFGVYRDVLTRVEEPLFAFDHQVDLVVNEGTVAVLSQTAFAAFFRDQDALMAQAPAWGSALAVPLPFAEGSIDLLVAKAQRDSRLRTRLEAAATSGVLANVTLGDLTQALPEFGLAPDDFVTDGHIVVTEENAHDLLQVLNEDLFQGRFSHTPYRVDRKMRR